MCERKLMRGRQREREIEARGWEREIEDKREIFNLNRNEIKNNVYKYY